MTGTNKKLTAAVETYFADLGRVRASGGATGERSSYGPLSNLLNAVGATLRPKVFCVGELADQGAGHPDFGLYAAKQVQKQDEMAILQRSNRCRLDSRSPRLRSHDRHHRLGHCPGPSSRVPNSRIKPSRTAWPARPGGRDGEDRLRGGLVRAERIEPPRGWPSQAAMGSGLLQRGRVSAA